MKKNVLFLSFFYMLTLSAQQSDIKGVMSIHNSEYETGKRQYVINAWVLINLGHSLLLRGKYDEAKVIYEKLKGKKYSVGNDFKTIIIKDMSDLEAEGITHKDMPRMKAEIEKW